MMAYNSRSDICFAQMYYNMPECIPEKRISLSLTTNNKIYVKRNAVMLI